MASYLQEVWQSRVLALTFALRDLKIQYAQTFLGLLWSLVQPLTGLLIYTFFFQRLIHIEVDAPYPVFVFTGIMGWHGFSALVVQSGAVKIRIDQRYPLAEVAQAHRDLEARKTTGCTILTL